jgi:hypothetical protein
LASEKTWAAPRVECPPFLRYHLARRWLPRAEGLSRLLHGRVNGWVDELREASASAPGPWRARSRCCLVRSLLPNACEKAALLGFGLLLHGRMRRL